MKRKHWHYRGDVNIEHGGVYYNLDNWKYDYVEAVRYQPCSDAGGPDNMGWIEHVTVNIPTDKVKMHNALQCCGWNDAEQALQLKKMTRAQRRHVIFDACLSYGYYDPDDLANLKTGNNYIVAVGRPHKRVTREGEFEATVKLRGNASLRNYVRSLCN